MSVDGNFWISLYKENIHIVTIFRSITQSFFNQPKIIIRENQENNLILKENFLKRQNTDIMNRNLVMVQF